VGITPKPLTGYHPGDTAIEPRWSMDQAGSGLLTLEGDWLARRGAMPGFPASTLAGSTADLRINSAGLGRWDSGLIVFLWDAKRAAVASGHGLDPSGLPAAASKLLGLLPDHLPLDHPVAARGFRPLYWLGGVTEVLLTQTGSIASLLEKVVKSGLLAPFGRVRMRRVDLLDNIRDAGPSALIIVSIVNFLIGAILAFVGAVQLRKFAADRYVADLVGLALVREMAAVMTAIIMAGRTGGAYAARLATMQANEEIDALTVTGIPVTDYVVLPAVVALVVTMPFLYLYGCLVGMAGGCVVALGMLDVTGAGYLNETFDAVGLSQFAFGFTKSIAFALLIGVASCWIGLRAGRSAADVGVAATRAVVTGIVGVIALDAVFAVLANLVGV
jgi:phospholipid/cholesterol/gamma-HCH transport system permease protein